jgi:hypothetical protein
MSCLHRNAVRDADFSLVFRRSFEDHPARAILRAAWRGSRAYPLGGWHCDILSHVQIVPTLSRVIHPEVTVGNRVLVGPSCHAQLSYHPRTQPRISRRICVPRFPECRGRLLSICVVMYFDIGHARTNGKEINKVYRLVAEA